MILCNKKILSLIPVVLLFTYLCFGNISVNQDEFIFDNTIQGEVISGTFIIKNNENKKAHITFHTSCDCLFLGSDEISLNPLEEHILFWDFSTEDYLGAVTVVIVVAIAGQDNVYLTISGNVVNKTGTQQTIMDNNSIIIISGIIIGIVFCIFLISAYQITKKKKRV